MDPLGYFLGGPRATRAFALVMDMAGSWGIDVQDEAALTVIAVLRGAARIDGTLIDDGDIAVVRGPNPYLVTDVDGSAASIEIGRDQLCRSLDGRDLRSELRTGVRRWGNTAHGETTLLIGTYDRPRDIAGLVENALPRLQVVRGTGTTDPTVSMLAHEIAREDAAGQIVIDRLLDVLTVNTIRRWTESSDDRADSWLTCDDPIVTAALACLHDRPEEPWTVASLAHHVTVSRATLASRFRAGVGQSPMAYLTNWRLTLARDLLHDPNQTIAAVGRAVGYTNAYAFSTAFKRETGDSPSDFRTRASRVDAPVRGRRRPHPPIESIV